MNYLFPKLLLGKVLVNIRYSKKGMDSRFRGNDIFEISISFTFRRQLRCADQGQPEMC